MHTFIKIIKIVDKQDVYTTKFNQNYYPDIEKIPFNQIIGKKSDKYTIFRNNTRYSTIKNIQHFYITIFNFCFLV